jgi:uncharacterized protein YdaU (DUF1376 family)
MPVRTDALLGDTTDMSATEFGAYVRVLLAMWRNGGWLPNDPKRLARYATLTAGQWLRSGPRIMECLVDMGDGRVTQGKLSDEYAAALSVSKSASANATSRWRKQRRQAVNGKAVEQQPHLPSDSYSDVQTDKSLKSMDVTDAGALQPQCYPYPTSIKKESPNGLSKVEMTEAEFDSFWARYRKKSGKAEARKAWIRARRTTAYETIALPLAAYIRAVELTDRQFIVGLAVWLNQRRWEDEDQSHSANRRSTSREDLEALSRITGRDDINRLMGPQLRVIES